MIFPPGMMSSFGGKSCQVLLDATNISWICIDVLIIYAVNQKIPSVDVDLTKTKQAGSATIAITRYNKADTQLPTIPSVLAINRPKFTILLSLQRVSKQKNLKACTGT